MRILGQGGNESAKRQPISYGQNVRLRINTPIMGGEQKLSKDIFYFLACALTSKAFFRLTERFTLYERAFFEIKTQIRFAVFASLIIAIFRNSEKPSWTGTKKAEP